MSEPRLPTFLVIGAMKAGTTSLWASLRRHPDVFMPEPKELHFFSNPDRFDRGVDWYAQQFAGAGDAVAVGEASTNYTKHPRRTGTAARIAPVLPDVKLIYLVREPVSRIRSHYLHVVHRYDERRPLDVAVREVPEYLDISRYRTQIDQYLAWFDRDQLLVLTADELRAQPEETVHRAFRFIGVDPAAVPPPRPRTTEMHQSDDKRLDTKVSGRLRTLPGYAVLRRAVPRSVRRRAVRATTQPLTAAVDAEVSDTLRARIGAELRDEVAGLREVIGPSFDGWGIA